MTLENITGNLLDAHKQSVPGQNLCSDQLMNERRTNKKLRKLWCYTADGGIYSVDNNTPTLRITREATNPVFNHLEDKINSSYEQIVTQGNYQVLPADFEVVKAAPDTVTIDLTQLTLQYRDEEYNYITIFTSKSSKKNKGYEQLNVEERKLAERVYGQGTDFVENMKMLNKSGIKETRVYVLNPEYVQEKAKENSIGRISWLNDFDNFSEFYTVVHLISGIDHLRGVRKQ